MRKQVSIIVLLASFLLPLVAGCAPSKEAETPKGYVEAGANAKPAKKGNNAGASQDL